MTRASGTPARAVPSAPTATGSPAQVLVPVMSAATILPTVRAMACPVLPQTTAPSRTPINRPRSPSGRIATGETTLMRRLYRAPAGSASSSMACAVEHRHRSTAGTMGRANAGGGGMTDRHGAAQRWITDLGLRPHPEGGYFREAYRASET